MTTYAALFSGPAAQLEPAATARVFRVPEEEEDSVFNYTETATLLAAAFARGPVLRVTFERSDLHVTKGGVPVSADLVFDCWFGFWPMKSGDVMLMGDTCVREDELPAVEQEIHRQGLDLTALHNHLIGETPKIMFLHLSGRGTPADLARKVKAVLARTATPTDPKREETESEKPDWSAITSVLGKPAEMEGDIVEYGFERRGRRARHDSNPGGVCGAQRNGPPQVDPAPRDEAAQPIPVATPTKCR